MATIMIDAGHGGFDNGAMYQGRKEKNDNLDLALAVGNILKQQGYDVLYTRDTDVYQSPYEKAQIANDAGADYFISFHRNAAEQDNTYNGIQTLIYGGDDSRARQLAEAINEGLAQFGFQNHGVEERKNLVVLRQTQMPAVLIETGFIDNDRDNRIFDSSFDEIAHAIAAAVEEVIPLHKNAASQEQKEDETERCGCKDMPKKDGNVVYGVEVGRFGYPTTANFLAEQLSDQGFPSHVFEDGGMLHVVAGREDSLDDAIALQEKLRALGYQTLIIAARD